MSPSRYDEPILRDFADYVAQRNIDINPLISLHRFPGRGLGIRANADIPPQTQLMFLPTEAVLKWSDIPSDFMPCPPPPAKDGGIRVQSRMASWLAFSDDARNAHEAWIALWPKLEDFKMGVPALWPERCRKSYTSEATRNRTKTGANGTKMRRLRRTDRPQNFAILPFSVTGRWLTGSTSEDTETLGLLSLQKRKFEGDLAAAAAYFPSTRDQLSTDYHKFLWAWWCVNTRSFYYWPSWSSPRKGFVKPRQPLPAPKDRDEAMVMCAGMDFFNHDPDRDSGSCCSVQYDESGYIVTSPDTQIAAGQELFVSYGAHSEEDLWVEYGFTIGGNNNKWDHIKLDAIILQDHRLPMDKQTLLEWRGYGGDYALNSGGVCWRTETAARMCVLTTENWESFVDGAYVESKGEVTAANTIIVGWIMKVRAEADNSLTGLLSMNEAEKFTIFSQSSDGNEEQRRKYAHGRAAMCVSRWEQIQQICEEGIRALRDIK